MIAFDIDGIIMNTQKPMLDKFNEIYGTDLKVDDWTDYSFEKSFGLPRAKILRAFREMVEENEDNPMYYEGAIDALQMYKNPLLFVTNREEKWAMIARRQLEKTLDKEIIVDFRSEYPKNNRVSKTKRLQDLDITVFYEDDPTWWKDYMKAGISVLTFPRRYNLKEIKETESLPLWEQLGLFTYYRDWKETMAYHCHSCLNKVEKIGVVNG